MIDRSCSPSSRTPRRAACLMLALLAACASPPRSTSEEDGLARLDMLVGHWEATHESAGGSKISSRVHADWDLGRRYVVARASWDLPPTPDEPAPKLFATTYFTWDPAARVYRTWGFDSFGTISSGTMRFEPQTATWHMKQTSRNVESGDRARGHGTMRYRNANEKTFAWTHVPAKGAARTARGKSRKVND